MVSLMQYRAAVGLHNIYLKAKEHSNRVKGKFWSTILFMFYMEAIYLPTLKRVIRSWQMTYYARLWFTQMCLYRLYIPLLIRLANDVEMNPGPLNYVDSSKTVTADYHQGDVSVFGRNAGSQCVAMCLTAVVYNNYYESNASWSRDKLNEILIQGNVLYSHISNSAGKDLLLLSDIPSALSINNENFSINFSSSFAGDLHMCDSRDCFVPLQHALNMLIKDYDAFLLTIEINTVAIIIDGKGHYRLFDSHSRDIHGNLVANGTAILLEFTNIAEVVQYLQNIYRGKNVVPFEVLGIKVKKLSGNQSSSCSLPFSTADNTIRGKEPCDQGTYHHHTCSSCYPMPDENGNQKKVLNKARGSEIGSPRKSHCYHLGLETENNPLQNIGNNRKRKQAKSDEDKKSLPTFREKKNRKKGAEINGTCKRDNMLQKYREKYEKRKAIETKEQRENRLRKCKEQRIKRKETESIEQREDRLRMHRELMRKKQEIETEQQRQNRLEKKAEQKRKRKQTESKEQQEGRLKKRRESERRLRGTETKKQKEERLNKRREAFSRRKGSKSTKTQNLEGHILQTSCDQLVVNFHKVVATGPTFVCACCDQLWYKHSLVRAETVLKLDNEAVLKCIRTREKCCTSHWVCRTCYTHLKQNKVPPCAAQNKMSFPDKPEHLDLTELEWRLVAPRLVFQKIHEAARGKQLKIHGNIVNVPADVTNTVGILPRLSTETDTIKVQLKRKLKYKNYVLSQNIRPSKVFEAAKWLIENGTRYQQESIKLNPDWNDLFTGDKENYIYDIPCSSSTNLTEMNTPVILNKSLNTTVQSLSKNGKSFSFHPDKVFICLDCEQVLTDWMRLETHMLHYHGVETDSECCEESNNIPIFHQNDCNGDEVVFFCSLCSAWEKEQSLFTQHMAIVHDLPPLENDLSSEYFSEATTDNAK